MWYFVIVMVVWGVKLRQTTKMFFLFWSYWNHPCLSAYKRPLTNYMWCAYKLAQMEGTYSLTPIPTEIVSVVCHCYPKASRGIFRTLLIFWLYRRLNSGPLGLAAMHSTTYNTTVTSYKDKLNNLVLTYWKLFLYKIIRYLITAAVSFN